MSFPEQNSYFQFYKLIVLQKKDCHALFNILKKTVLNRLLKDKNDLLRLCYTTSSYMGEGGQGLLLEKTNFLKQNDNKYTIKTFSLKIFDSP